MIDISGLDKGAVLSALWNNAALPPAHARPSPRTRPMSIREAREAVANHPYGFDYFEDRLLKVGISGDAFDPWGYDRDNGQGLAERVIAHLRSTGAVDRLPDEG